jgi:lipopolysaccharide export system permease protein
MRLLERYIFQKIASAFVLIFVALGAMVWLSQALREFDLVTGQGQGVWTFLKVSALLLPVLISIICPVALLIAVIYCLNSLNSDSELAVINASGAPQGTLLKPVLAIGLLATVFVGSMSLYFAPLSIRAWQELITNVRGDILTTIVRDGQFMSIGDGLTFHMRDRAQDGSFEGIFLSDEREADTTVTYLAEKGAILENSLGLFLIMTNGTIQQRDNTDQSISMIEFSSYAFDLSSFASSGSVPELPPSAQPTVYLLNPDPDDRFYRQSPGKFQAEFHDRLSSPLYALMFAVVPMVFLGQAASNRESRTASIAAATLLVVVLRSIGILLVGFAEASAVAIALMYAVPLGATVLASIMVLRGTGWRPPERVVTASEAVFSQIGRVMRVNSGAVNPGQ